MMPQGILSESFFLWIIIDFLLFEFLKLFWFIFLMDSFRRFFMCFFFSDFLRFSDFWDISQGCSQFALSVLPWITTRNCLVISLCDYIGISLIVTHELLAAFFHKFSRHNPQNLLQEISLELLERTLVGFREEHWEELMEKFSKNWKFS